MNRRIMGKIRVLIVDDHPVVLEGLRTMLSTDRNIEIVGEAGDGTEAVTMVEDKEPNVVLMDIRMPNMDGVQATRRIKHQFPSTAVIVLTMYDTDAYVVDAVRAGASGYLLKDATREMVVDTIRAVNSGATLIKTSLLTEAISSLVQSQKGRQPAEVGSPQEGVEQLTAREREVLKLAAVGYSNKDIARELNITQDTVKKHMQSIMGKLHASSRIHAAIQATRAGIIKY
jgi:DNA-binding NarL/FixJ family response regulator